MRRKRSTAACVFALASIAVSAFDLAKISFAQTNTAVTNSAAPSAISTTTGGNNLTYQSNNTYNNEFGFGPGVFCRTPALFISGNLTRADVDNYYSVSAGLPMSFNDNWNYGGSIGVVFPFGSSVQEYCKTVAKQTAVDREISTQLSMIRTCAALVREGIIVDPVKFPLLKPCVIGKGEPPLLVGAVPIQNIQPNASPVSSGTRTDLNSGTNSVRQPPRPTTSSPVLPKIPRLSGS
jgi:hypothetical protein